MTTVISKNKRKKLKKAFNKKIQSIFSQNYNGPGDVQIWSNVLINGRWESKWRASFDIPECIDPTVRPGIEWEKDVMRWCNEQYHSIVKALRMSFGMVKHWRTEKREEIIHFLTSPVLVLSPLDHPDTSRVVVPGWFNFTYSFPPTDLVIPEQYKWIEVPAHEEHECNEDFCNNGVHRKFIKIADARMLTSEEIEQLKNFSDYQRKTVEYQLQHSIHDWEFVGGSPFSDECFRLKKYNGINIYGDFSFPAIGPFAPDF